MLTISSTPFADFTSPKQTPPAFPDLLVVKPYNELDSDEEGQFHRKRGIRIKKKAFEATNSMSTQL